MHKSPSGGVYIGQTKNKTSHRWGHDGHNYLLLDKSGKYLHPIFAKAIIKYGWKSMEHVVLFDKLSKLEADMIEKDLIYYYKKIHKSYNVSDGGEGGNGVNKERVCQYDKTTGELIKIWNSIREAECALSINNIGACCHRRRNIAGDCIWRYEYENLKNVNPKEALWKMSRAVIQYTLDGNEIQRFDRIQDAVISTGISKKSIQECCVYRQKTGGGFIWRYVDENVKRKVNTDLIASGSKRVGKFDINGNLLEEYYSINEASRKTGVNSSTIGACCKFGRLNSINNCYWKFL